MPYSENAVSDSLSESLEDSLEKTYFRKSLLSILLAMLVMIFLFVVTFFIAVKGAERTVVPNVVDVTLNHALVKLQERELYPRLVEKYTGNPLDKGRVIQQEPAPGSYVRAGLRVSITVSLGAVMEKVENYVGMTISQVRSRLATQFSNFEPLLVIQEPITHIYDQREAGTVISQSPREGESLSEPTELVLIVSQGEQRLTRGVPLLTGMETMAAIQLLAAEAFIFEFASESTGDDSMPTGPEFKVLGQLPAPGVFVEPGSRVKLTYQALEAPDGRVNGLFEFQLPEYPVPVPLKINIQSPEEKEENLISMSHAGGYISFPYSLENGSAIVVYFNSEEIHRFIIDD